MQRVSTFLPRGAGIGPRSPLLYKGSDHLFSVEFFNFSKKRNSTKQPTSGSGTTFTNIDLKEDTSILAPILKIRVAGMPAPVTIAPVNTFTYCYIAKFNRYYFIDDWVYTPGMWEAHLSIDVLASHKTQIGSTSAYVERSASQYNGTIIDKLYPANTDYDIQYTALACSYNPIDPTGGMYVVGIINSAANTAGAVTYYAMGQSDLADLLNYMYGNNIWNASGISEISEGLFKSMFNPIQYIVSCMWLPFPYESFTSQGKVPVYLGYYATNVTAYQVTYLFQKTYITGTIPVHPQAATRGDYLNYAPYTDVTLYIPPFGSIPIDTSYLKKGMKLFAPTWIDHITGEATIRISFCPSADRIETNVCTERSAKLGVPIQLAQVLADYSHTIQTMQSGLSGGIAGLIAGAIGSTVQSALDAKYPSVSTSGSNGSFMGANIPCYAISHHVKIVDGDNADLGRPLMTTKTLNTLSGYIKCGEAHFAAPCLASEREKVESFMLAGFYYE